MASLPDLEVADIQYPRQNDVLLGRGGHGVSHPGNVKFRHIADSLKERFQGCTARVDKTRIARDLVMLWRNQTPRGRFLTRTNPSLGDSSNWHDVGDAEALKKSMTTLRKPISAYHTEMAALKASSSSIRYGPTNNTNTQHEGHQREQASSVVAASLGSSIFSQPFPQQTLLMGGGRPPIPSGARPDQEELTSSGARNREMYHRQRRLQMEQKQEQQEEQRSLQAHVEQLHQHARLQQQLEHMQYSGSMEYRPESSASASIQSAAHDESLPCAADLTDRAFSSTSSDEGGEKSSGGQSAVVTESTVGGSDGIDNSGSGQGGYSSYSSGC